MALEVVAGFVPGGNTVDNTNFVTRLFDVTEIHTAQQFDIGTCVECRDTTVGSRAIFAYHRGVAAVTVGDAVILKHTDDAAILLDDGVAGAEIGGLVGFAMAAVVAANYGWFQVYGRATANVASGFAADGLIYATTTAGTVDDAAGGGQVLNARSESAIDTPSTGKAYIDIWWPSIAGTAAGLA